MPNPRGDTFGAVFLGRSWARAAQASNARRNSALFNYPASRVPFAKDCADRGLADCALELASWRFRDPGPPRGPL
eukprot:11578084-Alexandrium_andersonii.AAC.1